MNSTESPPTTLSDERLRELQRLLNEKNKPTTNSLKSGLKDAAFSHFARTNAEEIAMDLLHAAEQMAIAHAALHKANEAMNTCKDHCYSDGSVHHQSYNSDKIGEAHIAVRQALPPAPEKGGKGESDYAPYCQYCGANEKQFCKCGPISKNH